MYNFWKVPCAKENKIPWLVGPLSTRGLAGERGSSSREGVAVEPTQQSPAKACRPHLSPSPSLLLSFRTHRLVTFYSSWRLYSASLSPRAACLGSTIPSCLCSHSTWNPSVPGNRAPHDAGPGLFTDLSSPGDWKLLQDTNCLNWLCVNLSDLFIRLFIY